MNEQNRTEQNRKVYSFFTVQLFFFCFIDEKKVKCFIIQLSLVLPMILFRCSKNEILCPLIVLFSIEIGSGIFLKILTALRCYIKFDKVEKLDNYLFILKR